MKNAVYCIAQTRVQAEAIVDGLKNAGFLNTEISVLFSDKSGTRDFSHEQNTKMPEGATTGGVAGMFTVGLGLFGAAALWALSGDDDPDVPMNAVDVGFLQDMVDHHEQALLISDTYLENNPDGDAAPYAHEVVMFQTRDLGWMRDWLAEEGYEEGEPDRSAMEWMNTPTPVAEMPGMQSQEQLDELAAANGAKPETIEFAEAVSRNQKIEVVEYANAVERLGLR